MIYYIKLHIGDWLEYALNTFYVLLIAALLTFIIGGLYYQFKDCATSDEVNPLLWNNGIHTKDGGKWEFKQASSERHDTIRFFICDKCGAVLEKPDWGRFSIDGATIDTQEELANYKKGGD